MVYDFKLPDIGEGLVEGLLVKWVVKVGDIVKKDQTLAQIGTDKAVVDLPSPIAGKVLKLLYVEGTSVPVGKPIIQFDENSTVASSPNKESAPVAPPYNPNPKTIAEPTTPVIQPVVAPVIPLATKPAEQSFTPVSNLSSSILATPQVRSYASEHHVDLATIRPTGIHGEITLNDITGGAHEQIAVHVEHQAQQVGHAHDILATPSVRQLARELKVDLNNVTGSGEIGRITADDVRRAVNAPQSASLSASTSAPSKLVANSITSSTSSSSAVMTTDILQDATPTIRPTSDPSAYTEIIPMSRIRQTISQRMVQSLRTTAQVTMTDDANVTAIVALREKYKESAAKRNIKLTFLPFFVKAVTAALHQHPMFNSSIDDEKKQIILKKYYHIGFATDTPDGLLVPVLKDADKLSIYDIARQISELAEKARSKKLAASDMNDGTFTITSVGALGVESFTPIINYPQVGILGVGRIEDRPEVINNEIKIQKMVTLSCSFDHRVVDGADAARFMQTIISYLQDPQLLLMEAA